MARGGREGQGGKETDEEGRDTRRRGDKGRKVTKKDGWGVLHALPKSHPMEAGGGEQDWFPRRQLVLGGLACGLLIVLWVGSHLPLPFPSLPAARVGEIPPPPPTPHHLASTPNYTPWEPRRPMPQAGAVAVAQTHTGMHGQTGICVRTLPHANVGSHGQPPA